MTVYASSQRDALRWRDVMASLGQFDNFLLRESESTWSVFDHRGKPLIASTKGVVGKHVAEASGVVQVDRVAIEREAREILFNDDLSLVSCSEGHAGASAADHSNFSVLCRRMLMDAAPDDLRHMFIVDSRQQACRVVGLMVDVARLGREMTDVFLDRAEWVKKSWPLLTRHHTDVLASRLAECRPRYVSDVIGECGRASGVAADTIIGLQTQWTLASPSAKYHFAQHLVATLIDGIRFIPGQAETFDSETIVLRAREVLAEFRTRLR